MSLSKEAKEVLVVAMANAKKAAEVSKAIDNANESSESNAADIAAIIIAFNSLCDLLEANKADITAVDFAGEKI